jgi:hypothetical protein
MPQLRSVRNDSTRRRRPAASAGSLASLRTGVAATWLPGGKVLSGEALQGSASTDNVKALTFHWRCTLAIDSEQGQA